ncbi:MAG: UDP-3-O-(3-hydroxymyristoyl)glucosamine N-acyltransferase [Prevotellaceae bacterium]|jgi:UDP-3-O-[3-hydroxymyristoyl] glucosamine N-acyltransferase|nr:UDP-3-O-(3-hydroxymyristoyl)glucosamine N-acyltransferase [Prevotellaceae bacterium]
MQLTAKTIAEHLKGTIEGDENVAVSGFARIEQANKGELCFLANPKYEDWLYKTKASLAIVSKKFKLREPVPYTVVWVDDAYRGIAAMLDLYAAMHSVQKKGREYPSHISWRAKMGKGCYIGRYAYVSKDAKIGNNVKIFPQVYIGDGVSVGDNTILYSGVKIYAGCHVGKNCILHSGCVIGSDGFGFAPDENRRYKKIPQVGNVILEDDVEVGANSTLDRATMNSTIIHRGVKLDNLVHIAHNVEVGADTVMAALNGIAGSSKIGERCMFGGQAGVVGHLTIGNDVLLAARTGIAGDVKDGESRMGFPDMPAGMYRRSHVIFKNLPDLQNKVSALQKEVEALKGEKR